MSSCAGVSSSAPSAPSPGRIPDSGLACFVKDVGVPPRRFKSQGLESREAGTMRTSFHHPEVVRYRAQDTNQSLKRLRNTTSRRYATKCKGAGTSPGTSSFTRLSDTLSDPTVQADRGQMKTTLHTIELSGKQPFPRKRFGAAGRLPAPALAMPCRTDAHHRQTNANAKRRKMLKMSVQLRIMSQQLVAVWLGLVISLTPNSAASV